MTIEVNKKQYCWECEEKKDVLVGLGDLKCCPHECFFICRDCLEKALRAIIVAEGR